MNRNLQNKIDYSIKLLQKYESLALSMSDNGYHLAFSGGKDSIVLYHLAKLANVKFEAVMCLTTLDYPELMRFIRTNYNDIKFNRPKINFFELIKKHKMLPLVKTRYCCYHLKEQAGSGTCTLIGIRAAESNRRAKRNEIEIANHKFSGSQDQFNIYKETTIQCVTGKDKILISPIFKYTDKDIWDFIKNYKLPYCKLYDNGYKRIGCIFCPMATKSTKIKDLQSYPKFAKQIIKSIQFLKDNYNYIEELTAEEIFDWWINNESLKKYIADTKQQLKLINMQIDIKDYKPQLHDRYKIIGLKSDEAKQILTPEYEINDTVFAEKQILIRKKSTTYRGNILIGSIDTNQSIGLVELYDVKPVSDLSEYDIDCISESERKKIKGKYAWMLCNPKKVVEVPIICTPSFSDFVCEKNYIVTYPTVLQIDKDDYNLIKSKIK